MKRTNLSLSLMVLILLVVTVLISCGPEPASTSVNLLPGADLAWEITWITPTVGIDVKAKLAKVDSIKSTRFNADTDRAMDLLVLGSGHDDDYPTTELTAFFEDTHMLISDTYANPFAALFTANNYDKWFNLYFTDHRFPAIYNPNKSGKTISLSSDSDTGTDDKRCDIGLPKEWAPARDEATNPNAPAWDCNLALSTSGRIELNLGLVIHKQPAIDVNRYSLFSSEADSYETLAHELSHAAFAMSDEYDEGGFFAVRQYPNVSLSGEEGPSFCSTDTEMGELHLLGDRTELVACRSATGSKLNLMQNMKLQTNPPQDWFDYKYFFNAANRQKYILEELCGAAKC